MEQEDEIYYITRILDGETEYFSVLLDRYSRPLYSLIVQIVGCPEDAEELLQDVFLKAFRNLSGYKQECRFSTWLYRIVYNTSISATRKRKQEFLYIEESAINNVPDEKIDEMIALGGDEEQIECLRKAIDQLEGEEKALITLFYYEEKSLEEISEILKITVGNVKVRLYRTRKKIYVLMNGKINR
ncbi:RNA polymerase sigma factor [Bacteroides caccae]|uniref:RNA polymerase sigma factor n=1 Tax=Bacteroides caccae TaxID=47678 RepID=UPI001F29F4FB|nr:RNA polymerase sigma factor [Bacteroides caccae]MCE8461952.1 RNA polymerase sigma factor [Bacteroides caccae]